MEKSQELETTGKNEGPSAEVFEIARYLPSARTLPTGAHGQSGPREARVSEAEVAEYRRMKPLLLKMLSEWERVRAIDPMISRILDGPD